MAQHQPHAGVGSAPTLGRQMGGVTDPAPRHVPGAEAAGLTRKAGCSRLFGVRRPEPPLWYRAAAAARRGRIRTVVGTRGRWRAEHRALARDQGWVAGRIPPLGGCPGLKPRAPATDWDPLRHLARTRANHIHPFPPAHATTADPTNGSGGQLGCRPRLWFPRTGLGEDARASWAGLFGAGRGASS